jgi:hypothetical protein
VDAIDRGLRSAMRSALLVSEGPVVSEAHYRGADVRTSVDLPICAGCRASSDR